MPQHIVIDVGAGAERASTPWLTYLLALEPATTSQVSLRL